MTLLLPVPRIHLCARCAIPNSIVLNNTEQVDCIGEQQVASHWALLLLWDGACLGKFVWVCDTHERCGRCALSAADVKHCTLLAAPCSTTWCSVESAVCIPAHYLLGWQWPYERDCELTQPARLHAQDACMLIPPPPPPPICGAEHCNVPHMLHPLVFMGAPFAAAVMAATAWLVAAAAVAVTDVYLSMCMSCA